MIDTRQNQVDEVLLSFKYPSRELASECNQKLDALLQSTIIPSLENSFKSVSSPGLRIEIDSLAIDLGKIAEREIDEGLGQRIYELLKEALLKKIKEKTGLPTEEISKKEGRNSNLVLLALESFLIKGYFPSWVDSSWSLHSMLNGLFENSPNDLSGLLGRLIRKHESVRSRVAFLDDHYFDTIVKLLIPEDAEWIIGFREAYLSVQKHRAKLNSPEKRLKKALNLFIITYIALDSGPRFNRMSFSDSFLKSIAAHHNLEFEFFLKEIIQIVDQVSVQSTWHQGFKETIDWIAERNAEPESQLGFPNAQEVIQWFNFSSPTGNTPVWLAQLMDSGLVFKTLLDKYPGFWIQLSPQGQKKLLRIMAGKDGDLWERMADFSIAFIQKESEIVKTSSKIIDLRDLLHVAAKQVENNSLLLVNREDWFEALVHFALSYFSLDSKAGLSKLKVLLDIGIKNGIPEAPLLLGKSLQERSNLGQYPISSNGYQSNETGQQSLAEVIFPQKPSDKFLSKTQHSSKENGISKHEKVHREEFFQAESIAAQILWKYLNSGVLAGVYSLVNQDDLKRSLQGVVESKNVILVEWIKKANPTSYPLMEKRIWALANQIDSSQFADYLEVFGGNQTLQALKLSAKLRSIFQIKSDKTDLLDELIWKIFFAETSKLSSLAIPSRIIFDLEFLEDAIASISQMSTLTKENQKTIFGLEADLERKKSGFFNLISSSRQIQFFKRSDKSWPLLENKEAFSSGFLKLKKLHKTKLSRASFTLATPAKRKLEGWAGLLALDAADLRLLVEEAADSTYWEREAQSIIQKDIHLMFGTQNDYSAWSQRRKKAATSRLALLSQNQPKILKKSLETYLPDLILKIPELQRLMNDREWKGFSNFLIAQFSGMRGVLDRFGSELGQASQQESKEIGVKSEERQDLPRIRLREYVKSASDLSSKSTLNTITRELFPSLGLGKALTDELVGLFMLADNFFADRQSQANWRKLLLATALRIVFDEGGFQRVTVKDLWGSLEQFLQTKPGYFSFSSHISGEAGRFKPQSNPVLSSEGQKRFGRILTQYSERESGLPWRQRLEMEQLMSSVLFLKNEGYVPWWSLVKKPSMLLLKTLEKIEQTSSEVAEVMLLIFSKKGLRNLISELNLKETQDLISWIAKSKYRRHYTGFLSALKEFGTELQEKRAAGESNVHSGMAKPGDDQSGLSGRNLESMKSTSGSDQDSPSIKDRASILDIDRLIRSSIHQSKEIELIRTWFFADPRIQQQFMDTLHWSSWMYARSLNPGIWKTLLIRYGHDYYVRDKHAFNRSFFEGFLTYLAKSHSEVNWESLFTKLLQKSEFNSTSYQNYKKQILNIFPSSGADNQPMIQLGDQVKVRNAGLILCWPFLSVLFSRLGLLEAGKIPVENQSKAVYILQNIAFGAYDFPEYELVLNKLLIGMKSSEHLDRVELSDEEIKLSESLIQGMKSNWERMNNASIDAVRETFLQREGLLEFGEEGFNLSIEKTGVDILLDSVSWNISMIRLPWMEKSLAVKWR